MAKITTISLARKKELNQPDELTTVSAKVIQFLSEHKRQTYGVIGALCAVAVLITSIHLYAARSERKASTLLAQAMDHYQKAAADKEPKAAFEDVKADFDQLISHYGGTVAGRIAAVRFADMAYEAGDYDRAITLYQQASGHFSEDPAIHDLVVCSLGYAYAAKGENQKAVDCFQKIAARTPKSLVQDQALFQLGLLYNELGDKTKSTEAYQKIVDEHPDSQYLGVAKRQLQG